MFAPGVFASARDHPLILVHSLLVIEGVSCARKNRHLHLSQSPSSHLSTATRFEVLRSPLGMIVHPTSIAQGRFGARYLLGLGFLPRDIPVP
ncbi:hypothetical protein C8Q79DRAFT_196769 [Trametes meyenii]|nr:hypothetical protein C8Q79DRAFT_196769 [Trametes meyenii]